MKKRKMAAKKIICIWYLWICVSELHTYNPKKKKWKQQPKPGKAAEAAAAQLTCDWIKRGKFDA